MIGALALITLFRMNGEEPTGNGKGLFTIAVECSTIDENQPENKTKHKKDNEYTLAPIKFRPHEKIFVSFKLDGKEVWKSDKKVTLCELVEESFK